MAPPNPFAKAIELFIEELRESEDPRSPFYQELLKAVAKLKYHDGADEQSSLSAQALQSYIENLDNEQRRCDKTRWIGRKLQPLVTGLIQLTSAMDTMIQAGPAPAMLIYGSAKLVLGLAQDFTECFDMMVEAMREIGTMLECYHIFSKTYDYADAMRNVLINSYKNVLRFWQKAAKLFTRNGVKTFFKGVVKPFNSEWRTLRSRLELDVRDVSIIAQALEGSAAKRRAEETKQQEKKQQIRSWLSGFDDTAQIDVRMDLDTIQKARHIGTCEWMFSDSEYRRWLTSSENENMWLHANPGTGKSVLCSTIIQQLQSERKKVVYFFCSFQEPPKRKITCALKSLALQLFSLHEDIPTDVERIFEHEARHGHTKLQNPTVVLAVLQALLKSLDRIHIVLDGLDECEDHGLTTKLLSECFSTPSFGIVKWLWASRIEPDFQRLSSHARARLIQIPKSQVEDDIKIFIEGSPEMAGNSHKSVNEWVVASEGNFLWLTLMLRTLTGCDLTCPAEVEEELGRFPRGLKQCYERVLDQLKKKSKSQQELARKLFLLVAFAEQPLTLHETLDALSIDEKSGGVSSDRKPFEFLVKQLCCPLILLDLTSKNGRHDFVLRYFHKSTRDFFIQDPTSLEITGSNKVFFATQKQGHLSMSKMCMAYLSDDRYRDPKSVDPESDTFVDNHGFMRYAALFWHSHFSHAGRTDHLFKLTEDFLRSANLWSCMRVQAVVAPYLFGRLIGVGDAAFSMIKPGYVDTSDEDYFATPLPDWLGDNDEGFIILQAYLALIREWNPILLQQPQAALQCHPGVLGSQNIFSTKGIESPSDYVADFKSSNNSAQQCDVSSKRPPDARILGTLPTKSGLRIFSLGDSQEANPANLVLKQWHANLDDSSSNGKLEIKEKRVWDVKSLIKLPSLQLRSEKNVHEPAVWSLDLGSLTLSVSRAGKDVHFSPPSEIRQSWLNISNSISSGNRTVRDIRQRQHHNGHQLIIFVSWKLSLQTDSSETDYDSEDSDDSDSDVSNDDSDSGLRKPSSHSGGRTKSRGETCFGLVIAIDGVNEPVWWSWESTTESVLDFVPGYNPRNSMIVWSVGKLLVQYACFATRTSRQISLQALDASAGSEMLLRDLHFSKCGTILHCLTVRFEKDLATQHTVYSISLRKLALIYKTGIITFAEPTPKSSPISVTYTTRSNTSSATILRSWTDDWLYLAINSSSFLCAVKVLKLPLSATQQADSFPAQALPETIYVPASFSTRSPNLEVLHTSMQEHIAFVLQSSTANRDTDLSLRQHSDAFADPSTKPVAPSARVPPLPLPPIMITRSVTGLGSWQAWDAERDGKEPNLDSESDFIEYMKGNYAASDQRFSVPIRSGLNWRKAMTVSCW